MKTIETERLLLTPWTESKEDAEGLYAYAKAGTPIYIIDPKDVPVRDGRITHIKDVATKGMEEFKKLLK